MVNVVVTTFNLDRRGKFLKCAGILMSYLVGASKDSIDKIIIYNLGIPQDIAYKFARFSEKIEIVDFPEGTDQLYPNYLEPRQYAWKCAALWDAQKYGDNILWLDACFIPTRDLKEVFDQIKNTGLFLLCDGTCPIRRSSSDEFFDLMKASEYEKDSPAVSTAMIGYNSNSKYRDFFKEVFDYSVKGACHGDAIKHRTHETSLVSLLARRHNLDVIDYETSYDDKDPIQKRRFKIGDIEYTILRIKGHQSDLIYRGDLKYI